MVLKSDKEKVKTLLAETIRLLCKNGLNFKAEFSVEALVGITLDKDEEFFLSIKETVKSDVRPQKPDPPRASKESWRNSNREIKGEPGQSSSCQRKRTAETVTNVGGSGELLSLSLGDMQEGEQSFWSSVTGSDGEGGGGGGTESTNHAPKRAKVEASEDESNSNVIEIKGEPESGSEEEDGGGGGGGEASQVDQSGGDMSGTYTYATPVTSAQEMIGTNISQVWDQLPPFASMPGPSGMATGAGMSQDGQQQVPWRDSWQYGGGVVGGGTTRDRIGGHGAQNGSVDALTLAERVCRRILSARGELVPLRLMQQNFRGAVKSSQIVDAMETLTKEGLGYIVQDPRTTGKFFRKLSLECIRNNANFHKYRLSLSKYAENFGCQEFRERVGVRVGGDGRH